MLSYDHGCNQGQDAQLFLFIKTMLPVADVPRLERQSIGTGVPGTLLRNTNG